MNKLKYILLYLVFIFFVGCKPSKSVIEKVSETKNDTLYNKVETIIRPATLNNLTIFNICDSITGKPKEFLYKYVLEKDTLELSLLNNELNFSIDQVKQLQYKNDSLVRIINSDKKESKQETITKYKTPKWNWYLILILGVYFIITLIFTSIPKKLQSIIRKLIGLI